MENPEPKIMLIIGDDMDKKVFASQLEEIQSRVSWEEYPVYMSCSSVFQKGQSQHFVTMHDADHPTLMDLSYEVSDETHTDKLWSTVSD